MDQNRVKDKKWKERDNQDGPWRKTWSWREVLGFAAAYSMLDSTPPLAS